MRWILVAASAATALGCVARAEAPDYTVVRSMPHDTAAYTQGLVLAEGHLYESTGRYGRSQVRQIDPLTGRVTLAVALPDDRFGEGLALLDGTLYQLTWTSGIAYTYDASTLAPLDSFAYEGEGWGLTTDGTSLIMSDGSATLRFLDPRTFEPRRELTVTDQGSPLSQLNELEYARGEVFANVYRSDWIVRIDPTSGAVLAWIDLAGLLPPEHRTTSTDVLNGIAFDETTRHLLVTGKLWPTVFEIRLAAWPEEERVVGSRQ